MEYMPKRYGGQFFFWVAVFSRAFVVACVAVVAGGVCCCWLFLPVLLGWGFHPPTMTHQLFDAKWAWFGVCRRLWSQFMGIPKMSQPAKSDIIIRVVFCGSTQKMIYSGKKTTSPTTVGHAVVSDHWSSWTLFPNTNHHNRTSRLSFAFLILTAAWCRRIRLR